MAETTPPLTSTEADPSVTDPEPVGDIGTALTVTCKDGICVEKEYGNGLVRIDGAGVEKWRWRALLAEKRIERLERRLQRKWEPTVDYAIGLASVAYGVPRWELNAVAECESHKYTFAQHPGSHASGVMQFLPSTWASNRFGAAGFSVWDPVANLLGAAYHVSRYGWGAWVCKP